MKTYLDQKDIKSVVFLEANKESLSLANHSTHLAKSLICLCMPYRNRKSYLDLVPIINPEW